MIPTEFQNVTAQVKANVYFDGKVVSHSIITPEGDNKTLGLIFPGSFYFGTKAPELMEISDGTCVIKIDGENETRHIAEGQSFHVPGDSGFQIEVEAGICQYICSFLPA